MEFVADLIPDDKLEEIAVTFLETASNKDDRTKSEFFAEMLISLCQETLVLAAFAIAYTAAKSRNSSSTQ